MSKILDQYGKPIVAEKMIRVFNPGPGRDTLSAGGDYINPDQVGIDVYEKMLIDETMSSGFEFLKLALLSRLGEYAHENTKINDFIHGQFEGMHNSLLFIVEEMLSAIWAGFSVGEMVMDAVDGQVQLLDVQFIHPSLIEFRLYTEGVQKNRIKEAVLWGKGNEAIPVEKLVIYTHNGRFGNPYGNSRFRHAVPYQYILKKMMKAWPETLEKYGSPTLLAELENSDDMVVDEKGNELTALEYMTKLLNSIKNCNSLAVSGAKISALQYGRPLGNDFEQILNFINKMKWRGMLIPGLMADNDKDTGAYAMSQTHFDLFVLMLDKLTIDITETLLEQPIRRLITWNFGPQKSYGEFRRKQFKPETAKMMSDIFLQAVNYGALSPERYEDMAHMRAELNLPGIPKAEFDKMAEEREKRRIEIQGRLDEKKAQDGKNETDEDKAGDGSLADGGNGEEKMSRVLNGLTSFFSFR